MYKKAIVFAGTTEGRLIGEYLAKKGVDTHVCVATEYGESLLVPQENLKVSAKRMTTEEMLTFFEESKPTLVIDATHPYAAEVTKNIKNACEQGGYSYQRLLRESQDDEAEDAIYVESTKEAAEYLSGTTGNVLLTTGSKELKVFTSVPDYQKRLYARVLSLPNVAAQCAELGFTGKNLICMQGPFSKKLNEAMLEQMDASYLVTKESGATGGFQEKCEAAQEMGVKLIIIGRPLVEEGLSLIACKKMVNELFGLESNQKITLVGIGAGTKEGMTGQGRDVCREADLIIGARRMAEAAAFVGQAVYYEYDADKIKEYIQEHREYENIAIVLSGDVGFYSGAKKLIERLGDEVELVPGISSFVYFCSKLKKSWEHIKIASLHGRQENVLGMIQRYEEVFVLVGSKDGVSTLCRKLCWYGFGKVKISVGENLSYPNEKIFTGKAEDFVGASTDSLCVVLVENKKAKDRIITHGISDEEFLRGKVPMTKEEIRSISISKMQLKSDSVVYDIGAGTGSVSIEMARMLEEGCVYAIEKKEEAVELLERNKQKFAADNLKIVTGLAPEAFFPLPIPTHAFIGGSSGNLKEILMLLLLRNPGIRVVINAIAIETIAEIVECIKHLPVEDVDIVQVSAAKSKELGKYHLMMGMNPVFIVSFTGGGKNE